MWKHVRNITLIFIALALAGVWYITRPDVAQLPLDAVTGPKPNITEGREQIFPTIKVAEVDRWKAGEAPIAAPGLVVERFAESLDHPRNMYVLPNGDVLVAETNSPPREAGGIEGFVEKWLMGKAGAGVPSANRITLLRDADGDGKAELKTPFLTGLNSPFGMVLIGDTLYVANTDGLMAFPYKTGDTKITAKGKELTKFNAKAPNNHWTRNLAASPDGKKIYISVGSNSNIAEHGIESENGRAMVFEYDIAKDKKIPYAIGLRNPVGLDWDSRGRLWTVVNERDMLGSDLVPDYLALVEFGADYGWPQHYWGGFTDHRVSPPKPEKREYERRPDYALGAHTAPLGLAFGYKGKLGVGLTDGAFVARHGSWNRKPVSGYDVIFVPFPKGEPAGKPVNILTGFLDKDGKAQGRPTMLVIAKDGSLLVSDDVGNIVWRVRTKR
ncbi:MAG: sorbosone dehydrogenase [Sphingomonadales bacterium 35-56-22]|jgi:glucose/arabinose dehydrogenase|uniref:PQQ-dependent sugar dehydrogenase n=1 Tax=Sphingorhabdus sp. TaxID=1902408 RepID=UPI000BD1713A|nr:sorbosone dehydrogenase family protein [Sphingorhabdus sp.]OYY16911.1 MAG: sorbosone dehydrogenase [Sphingomonadales bacterium 35-56-22]OYY99063.1 MAG: sorbosone dehydrogenase [Sphingomonadales bacterium 28-56-43]OYZ61541.1 MAG: sorbosone dehydrogenase [Sphingomonadales bacterium 24-56-14]OZA83421.1 MAG: sorbosone dehydrogenase [Sphingomonadales bacterium 39-57-19]HQS12345.1 sorbosone dehydrogenase family protein [Sphingorhabdus sp.]